MRTGKRQFSSYKAVIKFLFEQLPMFQRQGAPAIKKDLTNIIKLCTALGNPQNNLKLVHIAGTNGKGSVSHILAALLGASKPKVGIYTSPHFKDYRERIKIGAFYIPERDVLRFVNENYDLIQDVRPSFFEITVAMAFWWFDIQKVDIAIIETGLGGRLDSTNIINPLLSVITNISLDHQNFLGDSLGEIASEKAGIIKKDVPVVIGRYQTETHPIFLKKAKSCLIPIVYSKDIVSLSLIKSKDALRSYQLDHGSAVIDFETDLLGAFQSENLSTGIAAYLLLCQQDPDLERDLAKVLVQLRNVGEMLAFKGRWQVLGAEPTIIADGAHNLEGIKKVVEELKKLKYKNLYLVLGFVRDKDIPQLLTLFPSNGLFYLTQANIPRALPVNDLSVIAKGLGYQVNSYKKVSTAYKKALSRAQPNDIVFIGGSLYVLAEILDS